jgi:CDP-diacylglycerol---serine O-phosphatidyltransferase
MTRHIPNFLTLCNLACGCYGTVAVFQGDLETAAIMIWLGAGFDFLDGFAARLLKKFSIIGKDLDSLADLITFCFLPGAILFSLINAGNLGLLGFSGFLLVVFGALRLAKFNNDTRQTETFYGLPVPASALFVSAFPYFTDQAHGFGTYLTMPVVLVFIAIFLSLMMVSDIKLLALKFKNVTWADNWPRFVLIGMSVIFIITLHVSALPMIILSYVILSVAINFFQK